MADKAFKVRAIFLRAERPGIGAQEFFFVLERLPSPREPRPVWIDLGVAAKRLDKSEPSTETKIETSVLSID